MGRTSNVYMILLFLQSAVFILFLMDYGHVTHIIYNSGKANTRTESGDDPISVIRETIGICTALKATKLSNCSLDDVVQLRPGVVLLTTTNLAYLDVTLNMLASIKRTGVCVNTTIIAEDATAYAFLRRMAVDDPAIHVLLTNSGETHSGEASRGQAGTYYGFFSKRQAYILALLEQGYAVLFSDADTFWFRDPFPYFQGDFDMFIRSQKSHYPTRRKNTKFCTGFIYFKATNATLKFMKSWVNILNYRKTHGNPGIVDQVVMNDLLVMDKPVHVNITLLDPDLFPWGSEFFKGPLHANHSTVVVHAANIRGHPAKLKKFKDYGMWLV